MLNGYTVDGRFTHLATTGCTHITAQGFEVQITIRKAMEGDLFYSVPISSILIDLDKHLSAERAWLQHGAMSI